MRGLLGVFQKAMVVHVKRDEYNRADALANLALDDAASRLHDAEREVAGKVAALLRKHEIGPQPTRLVFPEVTRLLRTDTPLKR